tara:strand:- start:215 stop:1228 length:1014 start_codon:yes stop_codon:yes gene_type:complete
MTVIIVSVNDAPVIDTSIVDPIVMDEDDELTLLSIDDLLDDGIVSDIDNTLEELSFNLFTDNENIHVVWDSTSASNPMLVPDSNYYGEGTLTLCVSDGEYEVCAENSITINPVNDAPESFMLDTLDAVIITMENVSTGSIEFLWEEGFDPDGDTLSYYFNATLTINSPSGSITSDYDSILTSANFSLAYQGIFDDIFALEGTTADILWDISVFDSEHDVESSNGPLSVEIDATDAVLSAIEALLPDEYALYQNYPNPFNPVTTIRYDLPENSLVHVIIYDMLGRHVTTLVNQTQDAGYKSIIWNATNDYGKPVSAGIYLYQIQAGEYMLTKKMVLLK